MKAAETKPKTSKDSNSKNGDGLKLVSKPMDVVQILHRDHQTVAEMFFQYKQLEEDDEKKELVAEIIKELSIHAQVEEELVYPAIREAAEDSEDMMDEADTEHHVVKYLLAELSEMEPDDDHYDSKVTVLCELVNHHVQEEEKEIFEKLEDADLDLEELGSKVMSRKEELSAKPPSVKQKPATTSRKKTASRK
jgi:hemerythrin superfamily protein